MPKTSVIINSQDTLGKSTQRSFTDVNPHAANSDLATFGQRLNAMTQNVHGGTIRIDKTDCDNETKISRDCIVAVNIFKDGAVSSQEVQAGATVTTDTRVFSSSNYFRLHYWSKTSTQYRTHAAEDFTLPDVTVQAETASGTPGIQKWEKNGSIASSNQLVTFVYVSLGSTGAGTYDITLHIDETDTFAALDFKFKLVITQYEEG